MSAPSSEDPRSFVVTRLRDAGCVFAEEEADLLIDAASSPEELAELVDKRRSGLPIEHLVGWAAFCGLRVRVTPGVFVPRQRTEFLVEQALAVAATPRVVVDLCCGSGALGLAVKTACPRVELVAVDIDVAAVSCAALNLDGLGTVLLGDLYQPLPRDLAGRVDLLLANVPYVPTGHLGLLPQEARLHEPHVALDGGTDGLDVLRRVLMEAAEWLAPGGCLLSEVSDLQRDEAIAASMTAGLTASVFTSEALETSVLVARTLCA